MDVWEFPTPIRAEVATHARIPFWLSQIIAIMHFTRNQVISKKLYIIKNVILMSDTINALFAPNVFMLQDNEYIYVFSRQSMKQAMNQHAYVDGHSFEY